MRKKTYNVTEENENLVQNGGSCTAHAIGNASEISYFSELGKINIDMNLFWQWRQDEKGISVNTGSSFPITYKLLEEFEDIFGGLPTTFENGTKGLVRLPKMYDWGTIRDDSERLYKAIREIQRKGSLGVIFAIPTNADTFSECNSAGDGFMKFTGDYTAGHAMCFEGYSELKFRNININGEERRMLLPEYFIVGNSWGQQWGKTKKGLTKLKAEDFTHLYHDISTMINYENETGEVVFYESVESATGENRIRKSISSAERLKESNFKEQFLEFYS